MRNVLWYFSKKYTPQWGQISPNSLKKITSLEYPRKLALLPSSFCEEIFVPVCECLDSFAAMSGVWHQQCSALSSVVMPCFRFFMHSRSLTHITGAAGAYEGEIDAHLGLLGKLYWTSWVALKGFNFVPSLEKAGEVSPSGTGYELKMQLGLAAEWCICLDLCDN